MIHIIIATVEGRENSLIRLLESIEKYFVDDFRVYVIQQYKANKFCLNKDHITIINIQDFGASNARNIGIELAAVDANHDDYFFFPDDDCLFKDFISLKQFLNYELILLDIRDESSFKRLGMITFSSRALHQFYKINCPRFLIKWGALKDYRFNTRYGPGSEIPAVEETELLGRILINNSKIKCIQLDKIIFHPLVEPTDKKLKDYAFAQGFLLRAFFLTNYRLFLIYLKCIIRPFIGYIVNIFSNRNRLYYKTRIQYILKGYFHDHS